MKSEQWNSIFAIAHTKQKRRIKELEDALKSIVSFPSNLPNAIKLMKTIAKVTLNSESNSEKATG